MESIKNQSVYGLKKKRDQRCKKFSIRREERTRGGRVNWRKITDRSRTDLAIGIFLFFLFFLANRRVPYEAIKPTFAPPIPATSGNKGEDGR